MRDLLGSLQLVLRAVRLAAASGGGQVPEKARLGAQFQALAGLGVGRIVALLGALLDFLRIDRHPRRPDLALEVRRAGLDPVQFGAGFVGQALGGGEFGHASPLPRLPLQKVVQPLLCLGHVPVSFRCLCRLNHT